ncbi:hypothetical protein ABT124_24920 [Streptomyces sp. NPDC001982]|uniref:hypothetical protein n=1 Tax=unclassified Streptomyces TaxID=2593676 RepID=UPI003318820E
MPVLTARTALPIPNRKDPAAARLTRGGRRLHLRVAATWPWRHELTNAFTRLATLPRPAT